jgi:predicted transposase YbfD/YdcC
VVSIDAMGCQKAIAQTIVDGGADYVLALKDNHPTLCEDVRLRLDAEVARGHLTALETVEKNHGRIEIRRYALGDRIDWLEAKPDWAGLQTVGRVESTRIIGDQTSTECRYFLCSFPDQDRFAAIVRGHWGIENQQHWVLDVQFGEDACRTRKDHSAENLALIRRIALNVLRHNGPPRDSIRCRKLRAALNDEYRLRLLLGQPSPATSPPINFQIDFRIASTGWKKSHGNSQEISGRGGAWSVEPSPEAAQDGGEQVVSGGGGDDRRTDAEHGGTG